MKFIFTFIVCIRQCILFGMVIGVFDVHYCVSIFVVSGTVCKKAEEHLWAGVVGGFPANCT